MIAYSHKSLDNLAIHEEAGQALGQHLITKDEADGIAASYPADLYSPNLFIRIGLFLLTAVIIFMGFGLFCLMMLDSAEAGFGILALIVSLLIYGSLEVLIRERKHFRSGIDDAMIWLGAGFMVAAVNLLNDVLWPLNQCILVFILSAFYLLRFGNPIMGCFAYISFLGIVFFGLIPLGETVRTAMPFLLMAISFAVYHVMRKYKHEHQLRHYKDCCTFIEILALVVLYAAGNYFIVREVSNSMFDLRLKEGEAIPGAWIFWILTVLIPIVYLVRGVQKKDVILIRTGLVLIAAAVLTIRYYYYFMAPETLMAIGGIIMICIAYGITKYLTPPKYGFTHVEPNDPKLGGLLQMESLIVAETFHGATPGADAQFDFGEGSGGGGGASGQY